MPSPPHRRTITFAAKLAGYGQIVKALMEHKEFGITAAEDILFNNGKITTSNMRLVEMKQKLTDKQVEAFLKHDGIMSVNVYDKFYEKVREKAKKGDSQRVPVWVFSFVIDLSQNRTVIAHNSA